MLELLNCLTTNLNQIFTSVFRLVTIFRILSNKLSLLEILCFENSIPVNCFFSKAFKVFEGPCLIQDTFFKSHLFSFFSSPNKIPLFTFALLVIFLHTLEVEKKQTQTTYGRRRVRVYPAGHTGGKRVLSSLLLPRSWYN